MYLKYLAKDDYRGSRARLGRRRNVGGLSGENSLQYCLIVLANEFVLSITKRRSLHFAIIDNIAFSLGNLLLKVKVCRLLRLCRMRVELLILEENYNSRVQRLESQWRAGSWPRCSAARESSDRAPRRLHNDTDSRSNVTPSHCLLNRGNN